MHMLFRGEKIIGTRVLEDGSGVGLVVKQGEDEITLVLPAQQIEEIARTFNDLVLGLRAQGIALSKPGAVNARTPHSAAIRVASKPGPADAPVERPVVLIFDAAKPSQTAYSMTSAAARQMGHDLVKQSREAERVHGTHQAQKLRPAPDPKPNRRERGEDQQESPDGSDRPVSSH